MQSRTNQPVTTGKHLYPAAAILYARDYAGKWLPQLCLGAGMRRRDTTSGSRFIEDHRFPSFPIGLGDGGPPLHSDLSDVGGRARHANSIAT
eukprot:3865604-Pyramimonas_sp.AAC.1